MGSLEGSSRNQTLENSNKLEDLKKLIRSPKVKKFYYIRHGRTDWVMDMIKLGPKDLPLNSLGVQKVKESARYIYTQPITHIISTDLKRCMETRDLIVREFPTPHNITVEVERSLRQRTYGDWSVYETDLNHLFGTLSEKYGLKYADIQKVLDEKLPPDGETHADFAFRISATFAKHLTSPTIQTPLFIAHGSVNHVLMELLGHNEVVLDYGSVMTVEFKNGQWEATVYDPDDN